MELMEMKSAKITRKGQIAIPQSIRKIEGLKEGDKIVILAYKNRIELMPMKKINIKSLTAISSEKVLAKDWLSKEEEEAWKDL